MNMTKHIDLLGMAAKDKVTGFSGGLRLYRSIYMDAFSYLLLLVFLKTVISLGVAGLTSLGLMSPKESRASCLCLILIGVILQTAKRGPLTNQSKGIGNERTD